MRLTMNPGVSLAITVVLPHAVASARMRAATSGAVAIEGMISTNGMIGAGLKKCSPTT